MVWEAALDTHQCSAQHHTNISLDLIRASEESIPFSIAVLMRRCSDEVASLQHAGCITSASCLCVRDQVWSWPIQGPYQSEAAVHTHSGAGERTPGLPAHAELVHRRLHLRPLRRAARWTSWTKEPAGELCQYLQCQRLFVTTGWLNSRENVLCFNIHLYPSCVFKA